MSISEQFVDAVQQKVREFVHNKGEAHQTNDRIRGSIAICQRRGNGIRVCTQVIRPISYK